MQCLALHVGHSLWKLHDLSLRRLCYSCPVHTRPKAQDLALLPKRKPHDISAAVRQRRTDAANLGSWAPSNANARQESKAGKQMCLTYSIVCDTYIYLYIYIYRCAMQDSCIPQTHRRLKNSQKCVVSRMQSTPPGIQASLQQRGAGDDLQGVAPAAEALHQQLWLHLPQRLRPSATKLREELQTGCSQEHILQKISLKHQSISCFT